MLTVHRRLRPHDFARMWISLIDTDDATEQILQTYGVEDELRALLALLGAKAKTAPMPDDFRAGVRKP